MTDHGGKRLDSKKDYWRQDLFRSLLVTFPAKSLLRFKCVSKLWGSLITDPDFIEHYLENQQKKEYPQLIFASTESKTDIVLESVAIVEVEVIEQGGAKTRKGQEFSRYHLGGFGRDQVTKECKIIRLFRPKGGFENHVHECEVFTLCSKGEASWRGIGEVAYFIRPAQQPAYVNGKLHWILDGRHANPSEVIISFDLHTEEFQAISHPSCCFEPSTDHYRWRFMGLFSLRGSLCLVEPDLQLNIWIMNQSDGIWEKLFSVDWELMNYRSPLAFPIAELKDGSFFVCHCGDNLQIYYPESKSFSEVLLQHGRTVVPSAYFESLVPLYGVPLVY
ncbi:hypothetical protein DITRI_Ditri20bG0030100 [Diplodiscus trichospermus]